jgi:hypothetical protein
MALVSKRVLSWVVLLLGAVGCGGKSESADPTVDAGTSDAANNDAASNGDCVIAVRTDNCCTTPEAVSASEVAQDPCLEPYRPKKIESQCLAAQPKECELIDCDYAQPKSRSVRRNAAGQCAFVDECQGDADCTLAFDYSECCVNCTGQILPTSLLAQDPCLATELFPGAGPADCKTPDCSAVKCASCLPEKADPRCVVDPDPGALKVCVQGS